jgi:hypothetical protein
MKYDRLARPCSLAVVKQARPEDNQAGLLPFLTPMQTFAPMHGNAR